MLSVLIHIVQLLEGNCTIQKIILQYIMQNNYRKENYILFYHLMGLIQLKFFQCEYSGINRDPLFFLSDHDELSLQMQLPFAPAFTGSET